MFGNWKNLFRSRKTIEQHIAVFGESGSGKTTLLSAFYGWHQEPNFRRINGYHLTADDTSQGQRLLSGYLQMQDSCLPPPTRYESCTFKFNIYVRGLANSAGSLVWHDYPGEWWTETKTEAEHNEKIKAFRTLLQSDIAFFLCDAQRLEDDGPKYIRRLFKNFRDEIERQRNEILSNGSNLSLFPRIWIICLSKADLISDKDVNWFHDQVIKTALDELEELKESFKLMLSGNSSNEMYQSIGEDFLLLSSAKFDKQSGKVVNLTDRIGIDLIPPISIVIPIEQALFWARTQTSAQITVYRLAEIFRSLTSNWMKYLPLVGNIFLMVDDTAKSLTKKLKEIETKAKEREDAVQAVVAAFRSKLKHDNVGQVYRSNKQ